MAQTQISSYIDEVPTISDVVNKNTNNLEHTAQERTDEAVFLSDAANNITARVIVWAGTYLKVKWFKDNKVFGSYKSKNYNRSRAQASLAYLKDKKLGQAAPTSLTLAGTQSGAVDSTSQFTATTNGGTVVTNQATWSSSDEEVATVSSTGLVTRVAAGTATITATYAGVSGTRTVTVTA